MFLYPILYIVSQKTAFVKHKKKKSHPHRISFPPAPHHISFPFSFTPPQPSEAKAKTLRHPPNPAQHPLPEKVLKIPNFTAKGTQNAVRINHVPPLRVPFAVKFWEFLEPSPKEGSERGLGRRPKVFAYL